MSCSKQPGAAASAAYRAGRGPDARRAKTNMRSLALLLLSPQSFASPRPTTSVKKLLSPARVRLNHLARYLLTLDDEITGQSSTSRIVGSEEELSHRIPNCTLERQRFICLHTTQLWDLAMKEVGRASPSFEGSIGLEPVRLVATDKESSADTLAIGAPFGLLDLG